MSVSSMSSLTLARRCQCGWLLYKFLDLSVLMSSVTLLQYWITANYHHQLQETWHILLPLSILSGTDLTSPGDTSGSAIAEGPREALVSRNPATTKHLTWKTCIVWHYLRDSMFSRCDTIPECDRQTDTQTDRHTDTRRRHIPCLA